MNEKIRDFIKNNIGYFAVAFASVIYILTAFLTVDKTGKSISQIIADGAIAFFLGLFINRIFDLQGIMSGERDKRVQAAKDEHGKLVLKISDNIDKLEEWCEVENARNYKMQRTRILARAGVKYSECFDEDGVAKPFKSDERGKMRAYRRAKNIKLTSLTTSELTGEGGKAQDINYLGKSKAQFEAEKSISDLISKLGTAMIFGYYGVRLIEGFDYSSLIWTALQVALFLVMGVISMYRAYMFVTDEYRSRIIKKIDNLQKFDNYIKNNTKNPISSITEGGYNNEQ